MKLVRRMASAVLIAMAIVVPMAGVGSPAGADPADIARQEGVWSHQYEVNGCRYKVNYLNYGTAPIAMIRIYTSTATACNQGAGTGLLLTRKNGTTITYTAGPVSTVTGLSDGCGSYTLKQIVDPVAGDAFGVVALIPGGAPFSGFRFYAEDGTATQLPRQVCSN